jgi:streptogramin lyase
LRTTDARTKLRKIASGGNLLDVRQLASHPNASLYVAAADAFGEDMGAIVRLEPQPGGSQSILRVLSSASGVAVEADGKLAVASELERRIERVDPDTGSAQLLLENGVLAAPRQLAIEADGSILIVDAGPPPQILRLLTSGAVEVLTLGGNLMDPVGIAVIGDPAGPATTLVSEPSGSLGPGWALGAGVLVACMRGRRRTWVRY